jgi:site-specific recombinase XerD
MGRNATSFSKSAFSEAGVETFRLTRLGESWLLAGDISRHSERTINSRRDILAKLSWFLADRQIGFCDVHALRQFLQYVTHGHKDPRGRWGNARNKRETTPGTVKTYHRHLRAFFNWLVKEGDLTASPMERIDPPIDRPDQIQPFTEQHLLKMFATAKKTLHPKRDEAILLLDSGLRASELCRLRCRDVDLGAGTVGMEGKGGKVRHLPFSRDTKKALYQYLNERGKLV